MNRNSFSVFFFIKRTKLLDNGEAPISLRIKVNGSYVESQIKRTVRPDLWNQPTESCKGRDRKSIETNEYIRMLKLKVLTIHRELELSGAHCTARLIMNKLYSAEEKQTMLALFRKHNDEIRKLIGIDYEKRTISRYDSCCRYLEDMIKRRYGKDDVTLAEVDGELIRNYEMHLKTVRGCQQNTVIRYMKCFKKVINMALADGLINRDPFIGIRFAAKEVIKDVLNKDELEAMLKRKFQIKRLEHARDVFVFCSFTGLAYVDLKNLRHDNIVRQEDGKQWIVLNRQKTGSVSHIPLLDIPLRLIEKYRDTAFAGFGGRVFRLCTIENADIQLKKIAKAANIDKRVTYHMARHSYATLCISMGVPIETISQTLGHRSISTTQIYADITRTKINEDMTNLAERIEGRYKLTE